MNFWREVVTSSDRSLQAILWLKARFPDPEVRSVQWSCGVPLVTDGQVNV